LTGVAAVTAEVQIAAEAWEIRIEDLCPLVRNSTGLAQALLKYAYSQAVRMVQATKCAMFHTVKQRLILWLLLAHNSQGELIPCTHESIAEALGTRRATVTVILNHLAAKGIVELERGRVTIKNHGELENASCDCFQLIQAAVEPELECDLLA
jgi:CRP-like cAMP-binding protein